MEKLSNAFFMTFLMLLTSPFFSDKICNKINEKFKHLIVMKKAQKLKMEVISVKNLTKDYGLGRGVFNVDLSVEKGEVYGFLGPNGAGKSTTIRHLMGFSKPDSGKVQILGKDTFKNYYKLLDKIGYLPGEIALPEGLTGKQFLKMMKELRHIKDDTQTNKLINMFKLDPSGDLKSMSLGQKRKLAVVTAFMHDPDILILDEPTSGLDPIMQEVFINFVIDEKKRGKTILLSSHIFSEVDATCDKISIIKDGKIVDKFVTNDLKHNKIKVYNLFFENNFGLDDFAYKIQGKNYITMVEKNEEKSCCTINIDEDYTNDLIRELSNSNIIDFTETKVSLQEYFMKFYKEDRTYEEV